MFTNQYWAWDGVIDPDFCDYVVSKIDWSKKEDAKLSEQGTPADPKIRITEVVWQDIQTPIGALAYQYIMLANEFAGWNFDVKYPQRTQIGRYVTGGHYKWHIDASSPDSRGMQRKLSCSILLNDPSEYEGGELEFEDIIGDSPPTKKGSVIVFPSMLKHRVTPVTSGERISAVCWGWGPAFK